ncbi:SprT family protein [Listeria sp. PSOL-1]|uniref:SprT family protein n=1 Tax=Listeria sp. PSOL-1 TaxID=1844999 RepID=UPI0013D67DA6|nr:SprT family protein [Listeria sp. PSOL-1]
MNNDELQQLMEQVSLHYFKKKFKHKARFNARLKTTGGRYLLLSHDIEMNPSYLAECGLDYFMSIMRHELCHYHLHLENKGYRHRDQDFKKLLQEVDAPRFSKPLKREVKVQQYSCEKCRQVFLRRRKFNVAKYRCGNCGGKLKYIGESKVKIGE